MRSHTHVHTCAHTHATAHEGQPAPLADQDNDPAPAVRGTPPQGPAPNSCPRGDQGWARGRQAPALPERLGRGSAGPGVRSGGTGVTVTWAGAFQGTPPTLGSSGTRGSFSSRALDEGEGSSEGPAATCGQAWGRCAATGKGHGAPRGHAPHDTQDTGVCTWQPSQTRACAQVPMAGAQTAGPPRPRPLCAHAARRPPRMVHTGRPLSMAAPGATCPATSVARRPCDQLPWHAREAAVPSPCLPPKRGPMRGWGAHPAPGPGLPNVLLSLGHQGWLT